MYESYFEEQSNATVLCTCSYSHRIKKKIVIDDDDDDTVITYFIRKRTL